MNETRIKVAPTLTDERQLEPDGLGFVQFIVPIAIAAVQAVQGIIARRKAKAAAKRDAAQLAQLNKQRSTLQAATDAAAAKKKALVTAAVVGGGLLAVYLISKRRRGA